jgi:hypothetical protein
VSCLGEAARITFCILPKDQWKDLNGFRIVGPVYKMTIEKLGDAELSSIMEITGDRQFFDSIAVMMEDVIKGHDQSQSISQVKHVTG